MSRRFTKGLKYLEEGIKAAMKGFRSKPKQTVWQWLDKHVVVPQITGSPYPGLLDTGKTPALRGLFDLYWLPRVHHFTLCKSARVGGTLFAICCALHKVSEWPGPILWVDPTRKSGGRFSRQELQPFIQECQPVKAKAYTDRERWTTLEMMFRDCTIGIVGTGSATDLGGRQAELLILNERDKFRPSLDNEAPPAQLAIVRTKQFRFTRKILENSTPTHEGGDTWTNFLAGSQHYCYIPCPRCQKYQRLTFSSEEKEVRFGEGLEPLPEGETRIEKTGRYFFEHCRNEDGAWDLDKVEKDTKYECAYCQEKIEHHELNWMMRRHKWIAHNPKAMEAGHVSAHYWAAYSCFENWGQVAKNFLLARGSVGKLHDFYNSDLGLPFIRRAAEIKESDLDVLIKMSPDYMIRSLPRKPEFITMAVDVQGNCYWWSVRAWGMMEETAELETWSALVDCGQAVSWEQIEEIAGLKELPNGGYNEYFHDGEAYRVSAGLIDSGYNAQENKNVYGFCEKHRHIFSPSKGGHEGQLRGSFLRLTPVMDGELELVWYHDDTFKQQLYYHCIKEKRGNWWVPRNAPQNWRAQLTAERTEEVKQKNGSFKLQWKVVGQEGNHLGDTEKMHLALGVEIEKQFDYLRDERARAEEEALTP